MSTRIYYSFMRITFYPQKWPHQQVISSFGTKKVATGHIGQVTTIRRTLLEENRLVGPKTPATGQVTTIRR